MTQERNGTAAVLGQEGTALTVEYQGKQLTAMMVGFPASFELNSGERVILVDGPEGLTARPLVRAIEIQLDRTTFARYNQINVNDQILRAQSSTIVELGGAAGSSVAEPAVAWVIETADDSPGQLVAVRWQQQ